MSKKLEALGAKVIEVPAIKIVSAADYAPLDAAVQALSDYKWLVFTSANGVEYFFERLLLAGKDARALAGVKLAAIGSATAEALSKHGLTADLIPSAYKAEELAEALADKISAGDKILIARAKVAREVLPKALRKIGAEVNVVTAYETIADCENKEELLQALTDGSASVVTFPSSSTVTNLLNVLGEHKDLLHKAALAAIGPITADTMRKHGLTPAVEAEQYTIDGLIAAIRKYFNK